MDDKLLMGRRIGYRVEVGILSCNSGGRRIVYVVVLGRAGGRGSVRICHLVGLHRVHWAGVVCHVQAATTMINLRIQNYSTRGVDSSSLRKGTRGVVGQ